MDSAITSAVNTPTRRQSAPQLTGIGGATNAQHARIRRGLRRRKLLRLALFSTLASCIAASAFVVHQYRASAQLIDARLASGYLTSRAGIYAAPRVLRAGQQLTRAHLVESLRRAGYVENAASNVWSGAFVVGCAASEHCVEIRPRKNTDARDALTAKGTEVDSRAAFAPEAVLVLFDQAGRISELSGDGVTLSAFALEPEALTNDAATKTGRRAALAYEDLPPVLVKAILSIEDRRFFAHHGVDLTGIARAVWSWRASSADDGTARQGGSTITQQLVKNTYLTPERTLRRKFNEAVLAAALERRLSKQDILALYCNEIYLGQRGSLAVRGTGQAARVFFGKELRDLSLAEAATIAGMIQSPARYAPDRHPEQARARRDVVLAAMLRDAQITAAELRAAAAEPVAAAPLASDSDDAVAPYFVDYVSRLVEARLQTTSDVDDSGLRVFTTIDLDLQRQAETAVHNELARLEKVYAGKGVTPQAALVALDPHTGRVLAMVGGNHYAMSQLNRATDARRQPGSVFKPFVYAAALEAGISPAATFSDAPRSFNYDRRAVYRPSNYGGGYSMHDVTMRHGLIHSLNVVTVDLALRVGLPRVGALAAACGLPQPEVAYPSLALGTTEATPLEVASAYTAFANDGARLRASAITRAVDATGASLFGDADAPRFAVLRPATAYMLTDMLTGVIEQGTARAARGLLQQTAAAGKTGTSRDGWFVGYTPNLVCVVWVGFDDNRQLGLTGAESALPVWQEFMRGALALRPELGAPAFIRPAGVDSIEIDPDTGMLATPDCPHRERLAVTPALAPRGECFTHLRFPVEVAAADLASTAMPTDATNVALTATRALAGSGARAVLQPPPAAHPDAPTTHAEYTGHSFRPTLTNDPQLAEPRPPQR